MQVGSAGLDRVVPANEAYVLPAPGGPAIVAVTQRTYANGIQQDIALATRSGLPGQNSLRVRLYGPIRAPSEGQTRMPEEFLPLHSVDNDIRRAVPGLPMQKSPFYVQNRYGPFGYAVGRRGSETCLYGFQRIRSREYSWNDRGSIDIRVRLCQADASEADLLAFMYGYTVNAFVDATGWNPYGEAAKPPEGLGAPGPDLYPSARGQVETVLPPAPPPPRLVQRARRPTARPAPRQAEPQLPQPIGPVVPPPPPGAVSTTLVPPTDAAAIVGASTIVPPPPGN
ncbi:cellulose biosynthesis protein BcsN [Tianweitania sediminis]|uniref:Cellulose biosynthesis protein BcsN n=2 Tax=Tianweitania sediminis TaxID=1502156 RepID=A0A8J7R6W4_9HYPH|nr:cellulose biosynthesis protein BcsN [Tianweitania sediminis]MBP0440965.1 cellulose biosynthesis protein BcsN [Tianweitania sediminis]